MNPPYDELRLRWNTGTPDVTTERCETFWCAVRGDNGKIFHRTLCYLNAHVLPLCDTCLNAPQNAVFIDDDHYAFTGWHEEACEHCETQWEFNREVIAWIRMPKLTEEQKARAVLAALDGKDTT